MANRSPLRRALIILFLLALSLLLYIQVRREAVPVESPAPPPPEPPARADTTAHQQARQSPAPPDTLPVRIAGGRKPAGTDQPVHYRPGALDAEIEVLEFVRDFYGDVKERAVSIRLAGSRLDSTAPARRVLRGGIAPEEGWTVKHFLLSVDSLRPLRVYIFPGWSYGSDWAPLPDGSFGLEGNLAQRHGTILLGSAERRDPLSGAVERKNDRLSVRLRANPGFTYLVRFGLECESPDWKDSSVTLFTHEVAVDFPAVRRCASLSGEAGDTLFIAARDPAAIREAALSFPAVPLLAVVLDADPDAEWTKEDLSARSDVSAFLNTSTPRAESFLLFNVGAALVERTEPDPAFDRIVRKHLGRGRHAGGLNDDDPSRPVLHRTELVRDPEAVRSLKALFRRYVSEAARQL